MAITKNRQSRETISVMAKKAFPDKQIAEIKELSLSKFNHIPQVAGCFLGHSPCWQNLTDSKGNLAEDEKHMLPSTHRWLHFKELNCCQRQTAISMGETQGEKKTKSKR